MYTAFGSDDTKTFNSNYPETDGVVENSISEHANEPHILFGSVMADDFLHAADLLTMIFRVWVVLSMVPGLRRSTRGSRSSCRALHPLERRPFRNVAVRCSILLMSVDAVVKAALRSALID